MGKFYLRMDEEIQVYFMINPDLVGNVQGLYYGKRNAVYFFKFIIGRGKNKFFCFLFRFLVQGFYLLVS